MEIETAHETDFDENSNYSQGKAKVKWKLDIDESHNIYAELGRGRFSVVKKCVEKRTGKEFAAKFIKKRLLNPDEVDHEIAILQELRHPNLNAIYDTFDTLKNYVLILELLSGGRLFDYIVVMDSLTERIVIGFLKQVLEALQHLHDCGYAHLDIKPENILLDGGPVPKAKLVDFGDTACIKDRITIHNLRGTPEFSAPELILSEPVDTMADMWSIGVVTYVVLCGVSPFYSKCLETMCANIINNSYEMSEDCFSDISPQAQEFIKLLLAKEKSERLDCQGCLNSPWMKSIEARSPSPAKANKLNTSRLAAFNARRRYQHEITSVSRVIQNMQNGESDV